MATATATATKRNIKVEVQGVSLGKRALCATVQFALAEKKPDKDVAEIWKTLSKRRLLGSLKFGDDDPDQTYAVGERLEVRGSFDTHKPSFDEEHATLKLTFDQDEVDEVDLIKFRFSSAWLCIDEITDIPAKSHSELEDWRDWPLGLVGLDGPLSERVMGVGVKNVGHLVDLVNGVFPLHTFVSMKLKGKLPKTIEKLELLFKEKEVDSPLGN